MNGHLGMPQYIYVGAVICYFFFFALFLRLFWWKRYADKHFWHKRPPLSIESLQAASAKSGQAMPRFSILVPARNEADVIERTVEHMTHLSYPADLYEVVVVTDEKEARAAEHRRETAVAAAVNEIQAGGEMASSARSATSAIRALSSYAPASEADHLVLGVLSALALREFDQVRRRLGQAGGIGLLKQIPGYLLRPIIWEASNLLLKRAERRLAPHLLRLLRIRLPEASEEDLQSAYAALLSLSIPTAVAYCTLKGGDGRSLGNRLATMAARAHHFLTREIIQSMCDSLADDLVDRLLQSGQADGLEERLSAIFREIFPTTQDIMERKLHDVNGRPGLPVLKHLVVPPDFDGTYGGALLGVEVPSTKGRALNWALSYIDGRSTWCGFYDAESRPDAHVMLHVAHRVIESNARSESVPRIFQGPVFQVRNWYEMGPFCKIASLYQSAAHEWFLPMLFRRIPFVGGTNVFVESRLLFAIGGYDHNTLTEDLELGARAYLKAGAWPEYLPYPSSEQTPPTFVGFYRQRLRWASGHLQVMDKVRSHIECDEAKRRKLLRSLWRKGQGEWIFYQSATLIPPLVLLLWTLGWVDPYVLSDGWRTAVNSLSAVYLLFTIYAFFHYLEYVDGTARPRKWLGQLVALAQLLVLPLAAFLFPVPYSSAMLLDVMGKRPSAWVKTPRTRE